MVMHLQESGAELAPGEFRTKSRLSGGSNHETAEPVKLGKIILFFSLFCGSMCLYFVRTRSKHLLVVCL